MHGRNLAILSLSCFVAIVAHALLGWAWTAMGGVVAGLFADSRPFSVAALAGGLSWSSLAGYSYLIAPGETAEMLSTMGAIFGGVPGPGVAIATVLIGVILGLVGALPARALRRALDERAMPRRIENQV